jgi:hypothetical protein
MVAERSPVLGFAEQVDERLSGGIAVLDTLNDRIVGDEDVHQALVIEGDASWTIEIRNVSRIVGLEVLFPDILHGLTRFIGGLANGDGQFLLGLGALRLPFEDVIVLQAVGIAGDLIADGLGQLSSFDTWLPGWRGVFGRTRARHQRESVGGKWCRGVPSSWPQRAGPGCFFRPRRCVPPCREPRSPRT